MDDPLSDVRARLDGRINYGRFTQKISVVGGGNIDVQAGGVLDNLIVALATAGIVDGGTIRSASRTMQIDNGGAVNVVSGGSMKAGNCCIVRGAGSSDAGGVGLCGLARLL